MGDFPKGGPNKGDAMAEKIQDKKIQKGPAGKAPSNPGQHAPGGKPGEKKAPDAKKGNDKKKW